MTDQEISDLLEAHETCEVLRTIGAVVAKAVTLRQVGVINHAGGALIESRGERAGRMDPDTWDRDAAAEGFMVVRFPTYSALYR